MKTEKETVLEKAGVSVSEVHGNLPPAAIKRMVADHASVNYDPEKHPKDLPFLGGRHCLWFITGLS